MSDGSKKPTFKHLKRKPRRVCEKCGAPMRLRITGPAVLAGNRQEAIYICECEHVQTYVEDLKPSPDSG